MRYRGGTRNLIARFVIRNNANDILSLEHYSLVTNGARRLGCDIKCWNWCCGNEAATHRANEAVSVLSRFDYVQISVSSCDTRRCDVGSILLLFNNSSQFLFSCQFSARYVASLLSLCLWLSVFHRFAFISSFHVEQRLSHQHHHHDHHSPCNSTKHLWSCFFYVCAITGTELSRKPIIR